MLELGLEPSVFIILCSVALAAGFIDAIAGGGGLLTVPALLSAGLPPHLALGTNKLAASFGSCAAAITFYKKRLFNPKFWWRSFLFTAIGAICGTLVVSVISTAWLEKLLPVIIIFTAIYSIFSKTQKYTGETLPDDNRALHKKQGLQGYIIGFYDGVAGPGTGAFWTVSTMALYKLNILFASGVAKAMNFTSNFTSLLTFIYLGHINWYLGLSMGLSIMVGAIIGAHTAIHFGAKFIRPLFITVVIIIAFKLAYQAWLQ
ncbi:sulfite exporter TauE/SafE family protein [Moritella viscosa]|uniref:sulfite exporter TauE/SafE family protein n=1 Tax=Moritella viscosa TaxID=80854 RepID=UPI00094DDB6D|nr:TSUP family transporter [Moritella viscosa]